MPRVLLKEPKAENFDEISYDSDDEDFAHEFQSYEDASKPNQNQNIDLKVSNVESSVRGEEVKENDLLTEIQFAHLKEEKPNQDSKGGQLRLPTTINFRDKSVCLSQDSHFYNKSYVKSEGSGDGKEQDIAMQLYASGEFDGIDKGQIPGFSFFGKRDMI